MSNSTTTNEQEQNKSCANRRFIFKSEADKSGDKSSNKSKKGRSKSKKKTQASGEVEPKEITLAEVTSLELLRQINLEDVMLLMTPRLVLTDWLNQTNQLLRQKFDLQTRLNELYARRDEILQIDQLKQAKIAPAIPAPTSHTLIASSHNTPMPITTINDFIAANSPDTNKATGAGAADSSSDNDTLNKTN